MLGRWRHVAADLLVLLVVAYAAPSGAAKATPISVQIELARTRAPAGTPIHAVVIVTNGATYAIKTRACSLSGLLGVDLNGPRYHPTIPVVAPACAKKYRLANGATRLSETVLTTYESCGPTTRPCGAGGKPPPLPAGVYRAVTVNLGLAKGVVMVTSGPVTLIN